MWNFLPDRVEDSSNICHVPGMTTHEPNQERVGFLGLGALGAPIAANLLSSGVPLTVWNRTPSKAEPLVAAGARLARTPAEAVPRGGVVFTILWDDASLEEVVTSDGFLDALGDGLHVSMTTVTPETSRRLAALHAARGSMFVEAPIFGIPAQAVARTLLVCLAGASAAKDRARPLLEKMGASKIVDYGESIGAGTATKLVGNFMIVAGFVAMQECFDVLRAAGVDPRPTLEMITTAILPTPSQQRYAAHLLSGNTGLTSAIPQKDVALFERFAAASHVQTPLAKQMSALLGAPPRPTD
jgi:3-hydroxyisobutyrate dehydrogenase-like beta-hydroxyacid dehydrogenase